MSKLFRHCLFLLIAALLCLPAQAFAADKSYKKPTKIPVYPDPVYKPLYEDADHPLAVLMDMAEQDGDARAQFILGDLYSKGKGGFAKDLKEAARWFEASARSGYIHSYLRLAALAVKRGDRVAAYQWYSLGEDRATRKDKELRNFMRARMDDLKNGKKALSRDDIRLAAKNGKDWWRGKTATVQKKRRYNH
ncbi:MAG: sel1 repeat family protein [Pseudomonadota bacterium]|jgi:TPR repeat protein|nr:sel1 repeat family protein [Pseudomonadota bacterium]QKK05220.1 MAG: sel1 repeat family protein [Pseudomonadota bacterium]